MILCLQLLEVQQQLAVAVSAERKKDAMIEQLDKVGGYSMLILFLSKVIAIFLITYCNLYAQLNII